MINIKKSLKRKCSNHIKIYYYGGGCINTACMLLLILRFRFKLYTIDPYYLICGLIIGLTMFGMAYITINKTAVNERNKRNDDNRS